MPPRPAPKKAADPALVLRHFIADISPLMPLSRIRFLVVALAALPALWALLHLVKAGASTWGGALSDRITRPLVLLSGWLLYAAIYFGLALSRTGVQVWTLFGLYGIY